jgi:hypothetical protein
MRCTVTIKGRSVTFESHCTDDEAIRFLRMRMARGIIVSSFADDLLQKVEKGVRLSRNQLNWIHKLVLDSPADRTRGTSSGQTRKPGSHKWAHPGT